MDGHTRLDQKLRADLKSCLRDRDRFSARVIRSILNELDNATAVDVRDQDIAEGSVEVARREVSHTEMHRILAEQIGERESALATFEEHQVHDRAEQLRRELEILRSYHEAGGASPA